MSCSRIAEIKSVSNEAHLECKWQFVKPAFGEVTGRWSLIQHGVNQWLLKAQLKQANYANVEDNRDQRCHFPRHYSLSQTEEAAKLPVHVTNEPSISSDCRGLERRLSDWRIVIEMLLMQT